MIKGLKLLHSLKFQKDLCPINFHFAQIQITAFREYSGNIPVINYTKTRPICFGAFVIQRRPDHLIAYFNHKNLTNQ